MSFPRRYHRWNVTHALVLTAGTVAALILARPGAPTDGTSVAAGSVLFVLAAWSTVALSRLAWIARRELGDGIGPILPNLLTLTRGVAAVVLIGTIPITATTVVDRPGSIWTIGVSLALIEVTDFLDGRAARRLARRSRPSVFGPTWDMENDALFTLALSLFHTLVMETGTFVVAIGLMRYVYVLGTGADGDPPVYPAAYKRYAKVTAATVVITLIASLIPWLPPWIRSGAPAIVLVMLTVSFGWDLVLQVRARGAQPEGRTSGGRG